MTRTHFPLFTVATCALLLSVTACGLGSTQTQQDDTNGSDDDAAERDGTTQMVAELDPDEQVSIVFESYNFGQAGAWTDTFTELIGRFEEEHPNISVTAQKPQGNSSNPATDTIPSVQNQIAAGNPPDVVQLGFSDLDFTINQLGAKPLDGLFGEEEVAAHFDGEKHAYAERARTLAEWDGATYGIPFVFSTPVLFYNATIFEAANLDPDDPPSTWAEVHDAALAIAEETDFEGAYIDCLTEASKDWCFQALVRSNDGYVLSDDRAELRYAEEPVVEVVTMAQEMVESGATPKFTQQQGYEGFARGEIGMLLESSALQAMFMSSADEGSWDLRATTMPSFGDKPAVSTNSGASLFIISDDPAKQRAGWELIKFLTSEEAYVTITTKIGYLPLRTGLVDDPDGLLEWAEQNPLSAPNLAQFENMEPWISLPGTSYLQIRDGMMAAVERVVYQGADPQAELRDAQEQGQQLMPAEDGQ